MKIITIANQKGGVAKSTTAAAILSCLRRTGKNVLGVDADPQGSLSYLLGADPNGKTLYDVLNGRPAFKWQETQQGDIFAGDKRLASVTVPVDFFRRKLGHLVRDYIVIDTGPGVSSLLLSALDAADLVIIPAKANAGSLRGIMDTVDTLDAIFGTRMTEYGVLLTQIHGRPTLAEQAFTGAIQQPARIVESIYTKP